jgi:hypothetical protein
MEKHCAWRSAQQKLKSFCIGRVLFDPFQNLKDGLKDLVCCQLGLLCETERNSTLELRQRDDGYSFVAAPV